MSLLEHFPHVASAYRRKRVKDGLGGSRDSYDTAVFTDRACWRQPAGDNEIQEFGKRGITVTNKIYFLTNPGLNENHIVTVGDETYDVTSQSEPDASAGLGVVWRVMVNRTSSGTTTS